MDNDISSMHVEYRFVEGQLDKELICMGLINAVFFAACLGDKSEQRVANWVKERFGKEPPRD